MLDDDDPRAHHLDSTVAHRRSDRARRADVEGVPGGHGRAVRADARTAATRPSTIRSSTSTTSTAGTARAFHPSRALQRRTSSTTPQLDATSRNHTCRATCSSRRTSTTTCTTARSREGDAWLASEIPKIMATDAYQERRRDLPAVGRRRRHPGDGRSAVHRRSRRTRSAGFVSEADYDTSSYLKTVAGRARRRRAAVRRPRADAAARMDDLFSVPMTASRSIAPCAVARDPASPPCSWRARPAGRAAAARALGRRPRREQLGAMMFFDPALSQPAGQACADCHAPTRRVPRSGERSLDVGGCCRRPVRRRATRRPRCTRGYVPPLHLDAAAAAGSAACSGTAARGSLEEQAGVPAAQSARDEQPRPASVVAAVRRGELRRARSATLFGPAALDDVDAAFAHVTEALAAFERTAAFAPFSSKYDRYLAGAGRAHRVRAARPGDLRGSARGNCASCHPSRPAPTARRRCSPTSATRTSASRATATASSTCSPPRSTPTAMRYVDHGLDDDGRRPRAGRQVPRADAAQHRAHGAVRPQRLLREPAVHARLPEHARCGCRPIRRSARGPPPRSRPRSIASTSATSGSSPRTSTISRRSSRR